MAQQRQNRDPGHALSHGRAEVILGRGSSIESFPLFGYDLRDHELLFEEKVNLFAELRKEQPVTWSGKTRPALDGLSVYPHTESGSIPTWIGVGGNPESVIRAARYGFSLMLAIIGGSTQRFAPFARLFREALAKFGFSEQPVGVHCPGHIARVAKERGFRVPTRASFDQDVGPGGALHVGSPETVARKVADTLIALDATRFDLKYGMGGLPHSKLITNIELYGTRVAPLVRDMLA